jgi:hypothetical protein
MEDRHRRPSPLTMNLGRIVAWPLVVGGSVLAVAWAWLNIADGGDVAGAISVAVSGLAAFAMAVVAIAITIDLVARAAAAFASRQPKFLSLDWMVPVAVVLGFLLGWAVWR